jgi:hypothetical protein
VSAAEDFTDRFIPDAWHFSTLVTRNPARLTEFLASEGYSEGRITLGEVMHRYHKQRAVRVLVFGSGVMLVYADSWTELRAAITAMTFGGHATLAGDAWTHGG